MSGMCRKHRWTRSSQSLGSGCPILVEEHRSASYRHVTYLQHVRLRYCSILLEQFWGCEFVGIIVHAKIGNLLQVGMKIRKWKQLSTPLHSPLHISLQLFRLFLQSKGTSTDWWRKSCWWQACQPSPWIMIQECPSLDPFYSCRCEDL